MKQKSQRELIYDNPEMFIGKDWTGSKWDNQAIEILVMYVMQQAANLDSLNQCSQMEVSLKSPNEIVIKDNGNGLPIASPSHIVSDTSALTRLLKWYMPTGQPTREFYSEYGFLGYLTRLLCVLAELLQIETFHQGHTYSVSCSRGEIVESLHRTENSDLRQGTRITFKPDTEVFSIPIFTESSLKMMVIKLAKEFPHVKFEFASVNSN